MKFEAPIGLDKMVSRKVPPGHCLSIKFPPGKLPPAQIPPGKLPLGELPPGSGLGLGVGLELGLENLTRWEFNGGQFTRGEFDQV